MSDEPDWYIRGRNWAEDLKRLRELEAIILGLSCEGEWCGKSPRGADDGLCDVCKAQAMLNSHPTQEEGS